MVLKLFKNFFMKEAVSIFDTASLLFKVYDMCK